MRVGLWSSRIGSSGLWSSGLCAAFLALACTSSACTSAWNETGPPPFTAAETNDALKPVKQLESQCYAGSESQQKQLVVHLEFVLYVDAQGNVSSDPVGGDLAPPLIECMRKGLDTLKFPAKGATDQLHLSVQLGK
jgi:hypothetical protein